MSEHHCWQDVGTVRCDCCSHCQPCRHTQSNAVIHVQSIQPTHDHVIVNTSTARLAVYCLWCCLYCWCFWRQTLHCRSFFYRNRSMTVTTHILLNWRTVADVIYTVRILQWQPRLVQGLSDLEKYSSIVGFNAAFNALYLYRSFSETIFLQVIALKDNG